VGTHEVCEICYNQHVDHFLILMICLIYFIQNCIKHSSVKVNSICIEIVGENQCGYHCNRDHCCICWYL